MKRLEQVPAALLLAVLVGWLSVAAGGPTGASGPGGAAEPTPHQRTLVVLGDSTGLDLGVGLQATAPPGVTVEDEALFGCGLAIADGATIHPPTIALRMVPACNAASPPQAQWPAVYAQSVSSTRPGDVVAFVAGQWEIADLELHGRVENLLSPAFRAYELRQLRLLERVATAHGAVLELFTLPPTGPEHPPRWTLYNQLLRRAAAEDPEHVRLVDWGRILSPDGRPGDYRDGVQVLIGGIHPPSFAPGNPYSGDASLTVAERFYHWMAPRLWPSILAPTVPAGRPPGRPGGKAAAGTLGGATGA